MNLASKLNMTKTDLEKELKDCLTGKSVNESLYLANFSCNRGRQ